jgi:hypothetical protein
MKHGDHCPMINGAAELGCACGVKYSEELRRGLKDARVALIPHTQPPQYLDVRKTIAVIEELESQVKRLEAERDKLMASLELIWEVDKGRSVPGKTHWAGCLHPACIAHRAMHPAQ